MFVHVPKTGGSAITAVLGGKIPKYPMHVPCRAIEEAQDRPSIGFTRNPWERMVSLYYYLWRSPRHHQPRVDRDEVKAMGFKRWLLEGQHWISHEPQPDGLIWNPWKRSYDRTSRYPGYEYVAQADLPPQQRRSTHWYLDGCTFIGRQESLQADWDTFMAEIGQPRIQIPRTNVTAAKPRDWAAEYDAETRDHVARYFRWDIEWGGYECH